MDETAQNIFGLPFTRIGASIASRAVLLSGPRSHGNKELGDPPNPQRAEGLLCVVIGAGLQVAALIYALLVSQAHAAVRFVTG